MSSRRRHTICLSDWSSDVCSSDLLFSERTSLYLNYALENERTDNGLPGRRGSLVSGVKQRLSDSSSVYVEERYQDGGSLRSEEPPAGKGHGHQLSHSH